MQFPVAIVKGGSVVAVYRYEQSFVSDDGVQHPAAAWVSWTEEDWAEKCPDWTIFPLIDAPPVPPPGKRVSRLPVADWVIGTDAVTVAYQLVDLSPAELTARLDDARAGKIAEVNAKRDRCYEAGFLFEGHVYQIDVESRTDMLAVEAKLNRGEANPHGGFWRTKANQMVAMDDAKVAVFIGAVGDYVGAIKARSWALKDAAAVSTDPAAIDPTTGWPGNG